MNTFFMNNRACWKGLIRKVNMKFFLITLDSNKTNIAKDISITPT